MTRPRNGRLPHWVRTGSRVPGWFGHDGFTLGPVSFIAADVCGPELRAHEYRHVFWFWVTLGLMCVMYLVEYAARILYQATRVRPFAPLRAWWWRKVLATAYARISWERDAHDYARVFWPRFDPIGAPR